MSGKFINKKINNTINSVISGHKDKIQNPYYKFSDKTPFLSTYYNQNTAQSTLDEGLKTSYSHSGELSGIKYNKINNFYLYGLEKAIISLENGEYGLESGGIEGDLYILPNTITPIPNDFFIINHIDKQVLFKVIDSSINTLENGSNMYTIRYKLDKVNNINIDVNVVDTFEMIIDNVGTQFKSIIKKYEYNYIENIEVLLEKLKKEYISLFFLEKLQTFIFNYKPQKDSEIMILYDSYLIEFVIKNKIFSGIDKYTYLDHMLHVDLSLYRDYNNTFFKLIETRDVNKNYSTIFSLELIDEYNSIFNIKPGIYDYYKLSPCINVCTTHTINIISLQVYNNIINNKKHNTISLESIVTKYIHNQRITIEDIEYIKYYIVNYDLEDYYFVPIIIYILEYEIKKIISIKECS